MNSDKVYYFLINNKTAIYTDDPSIKSLKKWLINKKIFSSLDNIHIDRLTEEEFNYFNSLNFNLGNKCRLTWYYDYY